MHIGLVYINIHINIFKYIKQNDSNVEKKKTSQFLCRLFDSIQSKMFDTNSIVDVNVKI